MNTAPETAAAIGRLLRPRSIALVGATENSFWSRSILQNLRTLGYTGAIHLVHPKQKEQFGLPCWPSVRHIPEPVDHAWIMTGTAAALPVLRDCAAREVRGVTMLTAGFKEAGPAGAMLEQELAAFCRESGITLLGPNCLGFVNARDRVPAYALLLGEAPLPGHAGAVLQSGAMLLHLHRLALARGMGLSYLVSSGNEATLDATDFLRFMVEDPDTRVVGALMEGIRNPAAFAAVARRALDLGKPLVVLKTGRSQAAARAATAHTGALTGADAVVDAFLAQHGCIRVDSVEELVETLGLLQANGWPEGRRAAVITPSGGACGILADLFHGSAVELPDFRPETRERLRDILPDFGTPQNPLDTTGFVVMDGTLMARTIDAVSSDPDFDLLAVVADPPREPGPTPERNEERLASLRDALGRSRLYTCVLSTVGTELTPYGRELAQRYGLHYVGGLAHGAGALHRAVRYGEARRRHLARGNGPAPSPAQTDRSVQFAQSSGPLHEAESKALLAAYGIPVTRDLMAADAGAALKAAVELGAPVVLKVLAADVPHKTEAGGVALNLRTPDEVRAAYDRILANVRRYKPDAAIAGVLVAEQVSGAAELIAGVTVDPQFGPVVVAGLGGVFVEVLKDAAMRLPPFDHAEALAMLEELRGRAVLNGVRGRPPADVDALAHTLVNLGRLALDWQDHLAELDINPLFVLPAGQGVKAADALVVLKNQEG